MKSVSIILWLVLPINLLGQSTLIYLDPESEKYGFEDSLSGKPITVGLYIRIDRINDSMYIACKRGTYQGIVNQFGVPYFPFTDSYLTTLDEICGSDEIGPDTPLKILSAPFFNDKGDFNMYYSYFIDMDNRCIPSDYYPCPAWADINTDSIPDYFYYIQKGEHCLNSSDIDSAIYWGKKAIEVAPNNPYAYFWSANTLIRHKSEFGLILGDTSTVRHNTNSEYSKYFEWVGECLEIAESLENNIFFSLEIQFAMKKFYRHSSKDRKKLKASKKKIRELKKLCSQLSNSY